MPRARFTATVLDGHKESAVEFPFDPEDRWSAPLVHFRRGRKGYRVRGKVNGVAFESFVVSRMRRLFLLLGDELKEEAGISAGDRVTFSVEP